MATFKKLDELFLFNSLASSFKQKILKEMNKNILIDIEQINLKELEIPLTTIQRRFKFSSKTKVLFLFSSSIFLIAEPISPNPTITTFFILWHQLFFFYFRFFLQYSFSYF